MPSLAPGEALITCERALRQLMRVAYKTSYGENWLSRFVDDDSRAEWHKRYEAERKARTPRGVAQLPDDELEYSQFFELRAIADRDWEPLAECLGKKAETMPLLKRFDRMRDSVAHSRDLLPFEQDLLSGIAGEIRNKVTIYMSTRDPSGEYYPRIESVMDSYGHSILNPDPNRIETKRTELVLQPGTTVSFTCRGTDPSGRLLDWSLDIFYGVTVLATATGNEAELIWNVSDSHVMEDLEVTVRLATHDAKYHRNGSYDQSCGFRYRIIPPAN